MDFQSDEAILLRRRPLGEPHLLVTLLGRRLGKLQVVAPGARKLLHRYDTRFEPGTVVYVNLARRRRQHLFRMECCETLLTPLRQPVRLPQLLLLSVGLEACERLAAEQAGEEPLHAVLLEYLLCLRSARLSLLLWDGLTARALQAAGFAPQLQACVRCGGALGGARRVCVSGELGGALCEGCVTKGAEQGEEAAGAALLRVPPGTLQLLLHLLSAPFAQLQKLRPSKAQAKEVHAILGAALRAVLGQELQTERVLRQWQETPRRRVLAEFDVDLGAPFPYS
ncbi:MAG: DNA repair protein RecO [Candidatus Tectomicrobia bacterium]|nr:DNA repair protein RecO [Candidatus Tectomicrobia bacterium]